MTKLNVVVDETNVTRRFDDLHGVKELRFGVEAESKGFSNLWFVRIQKNDVYIGCREAGSFTKVSLHESGQNHVKWTVNSSLVISEKWKAPESDDNGLSHALDIIFPTNFIFGWRTGERIKSSKRYVTVSAAKPGAAAVFPMCIAEKNANASAFNLGYLISTLPLSNGKSLCVYHRECSFDDAILGPEQLPELDWTKKDHPPDFAWIGWTKGTDFMPLRLVNVQGTRLA